MDERQCYHDEAASRFRNIAQPALPRRSRQTPLNVPLLWSRSFGPSLTLWKLRLPDDIIFSMRRFLTLVALLAALTATLPAARSGSRSASRSEPRSAPRSTATRSRSTTHGSPKCVDCARDSRGRIKRSPEAVRSFRSTHPCPATGNARGACPGYQVDHRVPLGKGGADDPSNMQWLSTPEHKAKTAAERR